MALQHSPSIVLNGLVLCLDAANPRSYPGSGTTWTDITGNGNNGTLYNSPTYSSDGTFNFSGGNYIGVNDNATLNISGDKTLSTWVYMGSTASCGISGKTSNTNLGMGLAYGWDGNGFMALAWNAVNQPALVRDAARDINKWCYLTAIQSGSTRYVYVWDSQGLRTASYNGSSGQSWAYSGSLWIGTGGLANGYNVPSGTKISAVQVYNRALSTDEVAQNFNAYRGRYGV